MIDLKHLGKQKTIPWGSIFKVAIIIIAFLWMNERDREQARDNVALVEIISAQQAYIDSMKCAGDLQMTMPIERVQM